jgi:hypothetical protein
MSGLVEVNYAGEGPTDRAVARKLILLAGARPGADYATRRGAAPGKDRLDRKLDAYNAAARHAPWLVLRDGDGECAVSLRAKLLPNPSCGMRLRIVVPTVEAWLIADRDALAAFLGIRAATLPTHPEQHADLKAALVQAAADSRNREIRSDFMPATRSGRREGPGYATQLMAFIESDWSPQRAVSAAPSLGRAMARLREVVDLFNPA